MVVAMTEPMLNTLLQLQVRDITLVNYQARGLEGFGRFLNLRPDLVFAVLSRVFDVLVNTIPLETDGRQPPPPKPPAGWREAFQVLFII